MKNYSHNSKGSPRAKIRDEGLSGQETISNNPASSGGDEGESQLLKKQSGSSAPAADTQRISGLPDISHDDVALLTGQQEIIVCSNGLITAYMITEREARSVWQVKLSDPVTAASDSAAGILVAAGEAIYRIGQQGTELLSHTGGNVRSMKAAGTSVYLVVAHADRMDGTLLKVDLTSGVIVSESSLRSAYTRLSAENSGKYIGLSDGTTFRMMTTRLDDPCPEREHPARSPREPGPAHPAERCCCPEKDDAKQPDPDDTKGLTADSPAQSPCDPGQTGIPTPGGGRVVGDGSGINYYPPGGRTGWDPCRAHLFFEVYHLHTAGAYLIAADRESRNVAVLNAADLSIVQRFQSRQAQLLLSHPAQPLMVLYNHSGKFWEAKYLDSFKKEAIDLAPGTLDPDLLMEVMTFTGSPLPGLKGGRAKTTGLIRVLVIPVLDPGQSFNDADLPNLKKYLQRAAFNNVELYYRENSFGMLEYIDFDIHGVDKGSGGAVRMPKPVADYYNPAYVGAHVDLVKSGLTFPAAIVFDGRESMTLNLQPQNGGRPASVLNVKFTAILASKMHTHFPVQIKFMGTETATISLKPPGGAALTLNLKFTAITVEIESNNIPAKLAELENYLDTVIAAAETAAGITSRLLTKPVIRRVDQDGVTLGLLVTTLSHTAATGPRLEVTSVSSTGGPDHFGLGSAFAGRFSISGGPASTTSLKNYLDFVTVLAQEEAGFNFAQRRLHDEPQVIADPAAGKLTTTFFISEEDGGPGATLTISNMVELGGLFDTATSVANTPVTAGRSNTPKEGEAGFDGFISDAFTQVVERLAPPGQHVNQREKILGFFKEYQAVIIGLINPAQVNPADDRYVHPDEMWHAGPSSMTPGMRSVEAPRTAVYRPAPKEIQLFSNWNLAFFTVPAEYLVYCHEMGHALGLGDLYEREAGYRDDVIYLGKWAMMDSHEAGSHHCGYHKRQAGWIKDNRVRVMERPPEDQTLTREYLLAPVERWPMGDSLVGAAQSAFGNTLPVVQIVELDLGGDADVYVQIEARGTGWLYSKALPHDPAVLITNCIVWWDDRRYAFNDKYRAPVHLLHDPAGMTKKGDSFDLARGAEFPAKGIIVKILDRKTVSGLEVFHIQVERKHSREFIDLFFSSADPYYKNPDLYIDWTGDNGPGGKSSDINPDKHRRFPVGQPQDQGETIFVPNSGEEVHWMVARLRNIGNVKALQVKLNFSICEPPGAGDRGNFKVIHTMVLNEFLPTGLNNPLTFPGRWAVPAGFKGHSCILVEIADYKIPTDTTGAVLATDDVWQANNKAQKNVDKIEPKSSSPYEPIHFDFSVNNSSKWPEYAYLEPEGLPYGMRLTVYPKRRKISAGETAIFRCKLELDDKVIDGSCRGDHDFRIICWRVDEEASTRWGGVEYQVRPRKRSETDLTGYWDQMEVEIKGHMTPDPGAGSVRIRLAYTDQHARWVSADLQPGGTFVYKEKPPIIRGQLLALALFQGNKYWSESRSPERKILPPPIIA